MNPPTGATHGAISRPAACIAFAPAAATAAPASLDANRPITLRPTTPAATASSPTAAGGIKSPNTQSALFKPGSGRESGPTVPVGHVLGDCGQSAPTRAGPELWTVGPATGGMARPGPIPSLASSFGSSAGVINVVGPEG